MDFALPVYPANVRLIDTIACKCAKAVNVLFDDSQDYLPRRCGCADRCQNERRGQRHWPRPSRRAVAYNLRTKAAPRCSIDRIEAIAKEEAKGIGEVIERESRPVIVRFPRPHIFLQMGRVKRIAIGCLLGALHDLTKIIGRKLSLRPSFKDLVLKEIARVNIDDDLAGPVENLLKDGKFFLRDLAPAPTPLPSQSFRTSAMPSQPASSDRHSAAWSCPPHKDNRHDSHGQAHGQPSRLV